MKEQTLSDKRIKIYTGDIIEGCKEWYWYYPNRDVKQFIKEMDNWCEDIGRTTLITAETFMEVLKDKAGDKLQ